MAYEIRATAEVVTAIAAFEDGQKLLAVRGGDCHVWPQDGTPISVAISDDGSQIAIGEPMDGLIGRTVVRSLADGAEVARLDRSVPWAANGDDFAVALHKDGWLRPGIWTPGEPPRELVVDIPGDVVPAGWSADGRTMLLFQQHRSRGGLYLLDVASGAVDDAARPGRRSFSLESRPELHGDAATAVWSDARMPWSAVEIDRDGSRTLLSASSRATYPGAEWREVTFPSADGTEIQAWLLSPEGDGPWPAIVYSHGGPTAVAGPTFDPICQAWVDNGFALLTVNYRGSSTFGDAYREALTGDVGGVDVADLVAGHRWLVDSGVARPDLILVNGYSWGGFLTLQCMATHPDLWAAGIAGAPVADWILASEDQNASLDAYDVALFGPDSPETRALKVRASPRTYVQDFAAPVLISTPESDSRTPLRPTQAFVDDMRAAGKDVTLELLKGGHSGVGPEQWIEMMESWIEFAGRVVASRSARI